MIERNKVDSFEVVTSRPSRKPAASLGAYVADRFTKFQASITTTDWGWTVSWKWYRKDWKKWMPPSKVVPRTMSGTVYVHRTSSLFLKRVWGLLLTRYKDALAAIYSFGEARPSKKIPMPPSKRGALQQFPSAFLYDAAVGSAYAAVLGKKLNFHAQMPVLHKVNQIDRVVRKTPYDVRDMTVTYQNLVKAYLGLVKQ